MFRKPALLPFSGKNKGQHLSCWTLHIELFKSLDNIISKFIKIYNFPVTTLGQEMSSDAYIATLTGLWCPVTEIIQCKGSDRLDNLPA